ncbi:MAG TPA: VanZ family protein, partial [Thermodesulfobacteriota bacterium]|nr:VanZ family protein [Thermodesulfobacteriota bacterium]
RMELVISRFETGQAMRIFFGLLSAAYISGIFFGADSQAAAGIGEFNPFSILHIPLYGILTALLLLTFLTKEIGRPARQYLIPGLIAFVVGCFDEYHQSFIPMREASIGDVLLDGAGVLLVLALAWRVPPGRWIPLFKKR